MTFTTDMLSEYGGTSRQSDGRLSYALAGRWWKEVGSVTESRGVRHIVASAVSYPLSETVGGQGMSLTGSGYRFMVKRSLPTPVAV